MKSAKIRTDDEYKNYSKQKLAKRFEFWIRSQGTKSIFKEGSNSHEKSNANLEKHFICPTVNGVKDQTTPNLGSFPNQFLMDIEVLNL